MDEPLDHDANRLHLTEIGEDQRTGAHADDRDVCEARDA
jgi:hypothetical protein